MSARVAPGKAGRVALGGARAGAAEWWSERLSAMVPASETLWCLADFVIHGRTSYAARIAWLRRPLSETLLILLPAVLFRHRDLGLKAIIEDYVHSAARLPSPVLAHAICFALGLAVVVAVLRIAMGGRDVDTSDMHVLVQTRLRGANLRVIPDCRGACLGLLFQP